MGSVLLANRGIFTDARGDPAWVHVVDDDEDVRTAMRRFLTVLGFQVRTHENAQAFLDGHNPHAHGCILLDVGMPGLDGLQLQKYLADTSTLMPIIFLTGCTDVPTCVAAMRAGAVDYLIKPFDPDELLNAVTLALLRCMDRRVALHRSTQLQERLASLTPREREVLLYVMDGRLNKQIAAELGTSEKTVKVHRGRALEKLQVRSVAEAARMFERARGASTPPG